MNTLDIKHSFCEKFKLSLADLSYIEEFITFKRIEEATTVIKPGDNNKNLYFIIEGYGVAYGITDSGEIKNIYLQRESHIITSISYIYENIPPKYYYEISANSLIAKISSDDLDMITSSNLAICNWYNNILKRSVSIMTFRLEGFLMKNAKERLIEYYEKDPELFTKSLKKHLAGILGITPNSLSRILSTEIDK